jgi:hypothetical protein
MLANLSKRRSYRIICTALFALILIGLPLTSLPLLTRTTGSLVAPFSAIPLAILILIWLVPYAIEKGTFPKEIQPLVNFVVFAVVITAGAFFLDGFYARGKDFLHQGLRALLTLGIGLSFYITLTAYIQNKSIVRQFLLFIYIGGILIILWSYFEFFLLRTYGTIAKFPNWITDFRTALVFQKDGLQYTKRLSGFAYEPSWFVLFFDMVLLPIWFSAVFQRKSLFTIKLWHFLVEDLLLLLGLIAFILSFPRIGLLALVVMLAYLGFLEIIKIYRALLAWVIRQKKFNLENKPILRKSLAGLLLMIILVMVIVVVFVFLEIASQSDPRYQLILDQVYSFNVDELSISETGFIILARRLAFYERTIYWFGGWNIFADHPFGVGLGNAGFYFVDNMNSLGYESFEIRNLLFQTNIIVNTKSLWFRLLAETGIIGFSLFMTWIYILWRSSAFIQKSRDPIMKIVGLAGKFFILAYLVEGFSVDSFALPYQWIIASLITASRLLVQKEISESTTAEPAIP